MGYNYSRSRTALHCSLGPLMAATYLRDEVLTAGIFIINSLIFSSWWRTIGGDKISRLAARPQQSINEKKLWGISTDKLFLCPSVPNKAEFENSTLQQKEWSIIFKLPSPAAAHRSYPYSLTDFLHLFYGLLRLMSQLGPGCQHELWFTSLCPCLW